MKVENWTCSDTELYREFKFANFKQAFAFITKVAAVAERLQHHPDWRNVYNTVQIKLTTHDAGDKVTPKDVELAKAINGVLEEVYGHGAKL
jgi:4a-hydroxytetrahydrobiopterin dehydratase